MDVLIAPWGNPAGWKKIIYKFKDKQVESNSSLKILQEVLKPDFTFILASDTLATDGSSYEEVRSNAAEKINHYCKDFGIKSYKAFIFPGTGIFQDMDTKKKFIFKGSSQDYYYSLIYKLTFELLSIISKQDNITGISFHLDITHGVNYMPVLAYRAVKEIAENLALFFKNNITLYVYNTDPAMPFSSAKEINVNEIENSKIFPNPVRKKLENLKLIDFYENLSSNKRAEINNKVNSSNSLSYRDLSTFIGSIVNGFPLVLFRFFPEAEQLKSLLENTYNVFESYINISNENELEVTRQLKLTENFKIVVLLFLISSMLKQKKIIENAKSEVSFDELVKIRKEFFSYDIKLENFISNEVEYNLKEILKSYNQENKWIPLIKIVRNEEPKPLNKRNFIAHSGFEYSAVEVKRDKDIIYFRYQDSCIDTIKNFSQEGLI